MTNVPRFHGIYNTTRLTWPINGDNHYREKVRKNERKWTKLPSAENLMAQLANNKRRNASQKPVVGKQREASNGILPRHHHSKTALARKQQRLSSRAEVKDKTSYGSEHSFEKNTSEDENEEAEYGTPEDPLYEDQRNVRAYASLLESFQSKVTEQPQAKRRKLNDDRNSDFGGAELGSSDEDSETSAISMVGDEEDLLRNEENSEDDEPSADPLSLDEEYDISDPFETHFGHETGKLEKDVKDHGQRAWQTKRLQLGQSGSWTITSPDLDNQHCSETRTLVDTTRIKHLKQRLQYRAAEIMPRFEAIQELLAAPIFGYQDLIYPARTVENSGHLRQILALHALNHIFKTRDRVLKNNERIARSREDEEIELRDQGFTRPKVLFLLATRQACVRYVNTLTDLCEPEQEENKKRFFETYSDDTRRFGKERPADFRELFDGNADDNFRVGIKFTRKNVKFFSRFYASDIIFASPLGLRLAIRGKTAKSHDHDFLSSIEVVVVDQTDAMLMQAWEHVEYIFEHLNLQPKEAHGCDFGRVRHWYLDGHAKFLRQTILVSAYLTPDINALSSKHMMNVAGTIKHQPHSTGMIENLNIPFRIRQTFSRFESSSISRDPEARFEHFKATLVPFIQRLVKDSEEGNAGIVLFIPSSYDFARLRNYFDDSNETRDIAFGTVSETASRADNQRAGDLFRTARHSVLLYTGRAHHFYRYTFKGVKRVLMYGLPDNPIFYQEIVGGFLGNAIKDDVIGEDEAMVRVLFSKWDALKLEQVVGTKRLKAMVKRDSGGDTFDFV